MVATRQHPDGDFPDATPTPSPAKTTTTPSSKETRSLTRAPNKSPSASSSGSYTHSPPYLLHLWLIFSLPLVVWDTGYVMLRPYTLPGGPLHKPIWSLYSIYGAVDLVYGWPAWNERAGFTMAQSVMNACEVVLYAYYLAVVWREASVGSKTVKGLAWYTGVSQDGREKVVSGPGVAGAVVVLFAASVMTCSKTLLYCRCIFFLITLFCAVCTPHRFLFSTPSSARHAILCLLNIPKGFREFFSDCVNIGHNSWTNLILYWIIPNGLWIVFPAYMIYILGNELITALENNGANTKKKA